MADLETTKEGLLINSRMNLSPDVVQTEGAGKAYQSVAQSMAIAVQDVTDYLRNVSTVASTAIAVSTQLMISTKEIEPYSSIITKSQETVDKAAGTFKEIGMSSGEILKNFPSGPSDTASNGGN